MPKSVSIDEAIHLAKQCQATGRFEEAIAIYRQLAEVLPTDQTAAIECNIGIASKALGRIDDAIAAYQRAISARPDVAAPLNNLANLLKDTGDLDEAIALFDRALAISLTDASIVNNRASAIEQTGDIDAAIAGYQRAVNLSPDFFNPFNNLVYAMHFSSRYNARDLLAKHKEWAVRFAEPFRSRWPNHANNRSPDRRLKIGFVSADLREHVVGRFMLPLIEHHDRDRFEFICYSNSLDIPDDTMRRLQRAADRWESIAALDDDAAAAKIQADQIDILIDLSLHLTRNRLGVFARKPAPVQATYLAYPSTSGITAIDYRITDPHLDPIDGDDSVYTEQSMRLPSTYWCYEPMAFARHLEPKLTRSGPITFGCLNNFNKCSIEARTTWRAILRAVPESRLLLHTRPGRHRDAFLDFFKIAGIVRSRIHFIGLQRLPEYFATYRDIDIALDPFPYGGGTTTCDALWMGVPVITLRGPTAVGRGGASILTNLGLPELIAETPEQYVSIANALANDQLAMHTLRNTLRSRFQQSPLMDVPRFTADFQNALRDMWQRHCVAASA